MEKEYLALLIYLVYSPILVFFIIEFNINSLSYAYFLLDNVIFIEEDIEIKQV